MANGVLTSNRSRSPSGCCGDDDVGVLPCGVYTIQHTVNDGLTDGQTNWLVLFQLLTLNGTDALSLSHYRWITDTLSACPGRHTQKTI